jgi:hypothetical protein
MNLLLPKNTTRFQLRLYWVVVMAADQCRVSFVPAGWTHTKQYALRPGYPAVWGGGCRESIDYKRAKAPPRLMNGSSTLLKRGGSSTRVKRRCHKGAKGDKA